jgi:hypothetical protein
LRGDPVMTTLNTLTADDNTLARHEVYRQVPEGSATITLSRRDQTDVQQRQIYARLDDGPTKTLIFGDSVTMYVEAGTHLLRANNTLFWKSVTFSVDSGEDVEFALINRSGKLGLGFLALLGVAPLTLSIERR